MLPAALTLSLLSLLAGGQAARYQHTAAITEVGEDWNAPKWYHGMDGPHFTIVQTLDENDLRRYEAGKWVTTNITGAKFDDAYKAGTDRLDEYFKGNNVPGTEVDDTVPTVALIYPTGAGRTVQTTFTFEYFLPHELHASPPAPHDAEVGILSVDANDVWVRVFGGYVGEKEIMDQAFGFLDQLRGEGIDVDDSVLAVAFYDAPTRVVGRHNEIWIWSKQSPTIQAITKARNSVQRAVEGVAKYFGLP